jgi:hypothetical protein
MIGPDRRDPVKIDTGGGHVLAEPITVPDGDSFLQTPIKLVDEALPALPGLTYLQMRRLGAHLAGLAESDDGPWAQPLLIDDSALPELPKLDRAQVARLAAVIEGVLGDPEA